MMKAIDLLLVKSHVLETGRVLASIIKKCISLVEIGI